MNRHHFETVLQELIAAKGLNKKELAQKCGFQERPFTTFYKAM